MTVDGEAAAAATAATNACASFSNEIAKAEVNLVVDQIMNMISVLKSEVIRQKGNKEVKAIEESAEDRIDEGLAYQESEDDFSDFEKMLDDVCMESGDDIHTAASDDFDTEEIFGNIFAESAEDDTDDYSVGMDDLFEESADDDMADFDAMLDAAIFEESGASDDYSDDDLFAGIFEEAAADDDSYESDDMDSLLGDILGV